MADDDKRDPPIVEPGFIHGLTVVDFGDYRVSRGLTRRPYSACQHHRLVYDGNERRIWCKDCERDVEPFDAFRLFCENAHAVSAALDRRAKEVAEAENHALISLAAKNIDKVWRKRDMIPCCPSCSAGLFPEDFKNGILGGMSREYAEALRNRKAKPSP